MPAARTTDFGALVAVYRHVGENFKVGAGYNFGVFPTIFGTSLSTIGVCS
ncbi:MULTISPECIES: hypothetical protein [Phyllobacteriaceae]|nr:hypothetical protein [Mesorhizobium sp. RMAD-H1]MBB2971893.1 hypothetical protein [Mesorhizobium sp. RMAD-H1]